MAKEINYHDHQYQKNLERLRSILKDLPPLCGEFFRGIEHTSSILTRLNYAYDLRLFFNYLVKYIDVFKDISVQQFTFEHLDQIEVTHFELFLEHISFYSHPNKTELKLKNQESGKARKLSSLRSFFTYFYKKEKIMRNTAELIDLPKIHEKPIIRLEVNEVAKLLDSVESGEGLTETQKKYHAYTKQRDLTILTLFLGTGIRISECVGLNVSDIDMDVNGFRITRKGGNQVILYFGDEVRRALLDYLEERKKIDILPGHEDALFISMQRKRISNRAVQNLVKKYSTLVAPLKKISPHKLRSTYGTTLYRETGDIYLVADVLGHKDVNTTKKHYAAISDEKRRIAARVIKLRED